MIQWNVHWDIAAKVVVLDLTHVLQGNIKISQGIINVKSVLKGSIVLLMVLLFLQIVPQVSQL
jgi:hypothetical protein